MARTGPFEKYYKKYEYWFINNSYVYESEIDAIKDILPDFNDAVEIGVGSGRFAAPLGIKRGLEPSGKMARIAQKRGISVTEGIAEDMPFDDGGFDLVLMVTTLCFLDDVDKAFSEVYRILKPGGCFINGFVDRDSRLGRTYQKIKDKNVFYRLADFYSVEEVKTILKKAGFKDFSYRQTIFKDLDDIKEVEESIKGYGSGSFVVISARKPDSNSK
jgi:SAM-dependent methyltransferase